MFLFLNNVASVANVAETSAWVPRISCFFSASAHAGDRAAILQSLKSCIHHPDDDRFQEVSSGICSVRNDSFGDLNEKLTFNLGIAAKALDGSDLSIQEKEVLLEFLTKESPEAGRAHLEKLMKMSANDRRVSIKKIYKNSRSCQANTTCDPSIETLDPELVLTPKQVEANFTSLSQEFQQKLTIAVLNQGSEGVDDFLYTLPTIKYAQRERFLAKLRKMNEEQADEAVAKFRTRRTCKVGAR